MPRLGEFKTIINSDTVSIATGTKKILLEEVSQDFYLDVRIDENRHTYGPFPAELLLRGSKLSVLKVTDLNFLQSTSNMHYLKAREELLKSGRKDDFESALILIFESDPLTGEGKTIRRATTGRIKFYYRK